MSEILEFILNFPELLALSVISLFRIFIAYFISITLAIILSYIAVSHSKLEKILIGIIDIMQSIPVLSFVPAVMIFLTKFGKPGAELASLILITTGMIWNLIFSYYSSLKSIPKELREVGKIAHIGPLNKFLFIDLPYAIPGLVWNSMLSFGGGWYFLMYCETITVGNIDVKLIGIGSAILNASEDGNIIAAIEGILSILIIVTLTFLLLWIPMETWSKKFVVEEEIHGKAISPSMFKATYKILDKIYHLLLRLASKFRDRPMSFDIVSKTAYIFVICLLSALGIFTLWLMTKIPLNELLDVPTSFLLSLMRVIVGICISSAIAVPLGVYIGLRANILARLRLVILILSCLPAPALIPVIFSALSKFDLGIEINAILVIILSSIWYIFFNTAGGVASIPQEYFDLAKITRMNRKDKLTKIIIPGSAKNMIVGFITAWGGAWNGTFVAEYIEFKGEKHALRGIGSLISESAEKGNLEMLMFSTILLAFSIFIINLFGWRKVLNFILQRHLT